MAREQLELARDLIKQKRYQDAERLLRTIDHPTAKKWLVQLQPYLTKRTSTKKLGRGKWIIAGVFLLLIVGGIALYLYSDAQRSQTVRLETDLFLACQLATNNSDAGCEQMAERIVRADRASAEYCANLYPAAFRGLMECLRDRGAIQ